MNGKQFIRRTRSWAKANGQTFELIPDGAKGGHQKMIVGGKTTTVKTGEIGTGLLAAMLKQLDIPKAEF